MFEPKMIKTAFFAAVVTAAGAFGASAATITFYEDADAMTGAVGSVDCLSCSGLVDLGPPAEWSGDSAQLFTLSDSGSATELAWVNDATGESYATGTKTNDPLNTFDSDAAYVLFKLGRDTALIRNDGDGSQTYSYTGLSGEGSGLSHYTEFGFRDVPQIPLPAAGFLLIGALGGLGAMARRRNK